MNADGKIYIVITDKLPGGGSLGSVPEDGGDRKTKEDSGLFAHWARSQLLGTVKRTALTAVNYTLGNIGNFTGNYITQTHINESRNNLRGLITIGASALAGFKVGGPWGAVIGATLGVVNESVSAFTSIYSNQVQNRKTNYEIEQLRDRAGMNSLRDGSRGTEN